MNLCYTRFRVGYSSLSKIAGEIMKNVILYSLYGHRKRYICTQSGVSSDDSCGSHISSHIFKDWQELRKNKLTPSTFGRAVGFWPGHCGQHCDRVQLWLEKIEAINPFAGNLATNWNNINEEAALHRYKVMTGNEVIRPKFLVHDSKNDFLAASPDGIIDSYAYGNDLPSCGVLEIKCPYFGGDKKVSYPWKRIPMIYIPQAQGLMEILDRDWMDMYCWTLNGSTLFRVHRDREYWEILNRALCDFWWKHVQPAKEIRNRYKIEDPVVELNWLVPAPKHELYQEIVYRSIIVSDKSELKMKEINGVIQ